MVACMGFQAMCLIGTTGISCNVWDLRFRSALRKIAKFSILYNIPLVRAEVDHSWE